MEEIMVFKTNASRRTSLRRLNEILKNTAGAKAWNFDFEDCDNIFRLVSTGITGSKVKEILAEAGIEATELEDVYISASKDQEVYSLYLSK